MILRLVVVGVVLLVVVLRGVWCSFDE